jgi:hypothetical protein
VRASRRLSRSTSQVGLGTFRLSLRNDPRQNGLHRGEAWIIRLSNDRKQLKPQIIAGMFDEFANRTRGKIRHCHRRGGGAALELPRYARIQRRQDAGCDIGPVKLRDEFSEHVALVLRADSLCDQKICPRHETDGFIGREESALH